jgi:ABC transport system ATP-binding/permease protein
MWLLHVAAAGRDDRQVFRVRPGGVKTVGRANRADFIVRAPLVSRLHCCLSASHDGELEVRDLRSTNGTFVNDFRIQQAQLTPGDRLRVGSCELLVTRE